MFIALLVALPYTLFVSLVVFGGGQVFMPMFQQMWLFLANTFGVAISEDTINQIFAIGNLTPGVFSTQMSIFTGLLVANGQWWGWIAMFLSYLIFTVPASLIMLIGIRLMKHASDNVYLKNTVTIMKPIIAAIIVALIIQLLIGMLLPFVGFNSSLDSYLQYNATDDIQTRAGFFQGWRLYVTPFFVIFTVGLNLFLTKKYKVHLMINLVISLVLAFLVYQPWLT